MAAWIVITSENINDYLVGAQAVALRSAALAQGQDDPFPTVMRDRASYVRNRIANRVQLSATENAIPPELKTSACMLIVEALQGRIPSLKLTDDQRTMIGRAYKDLDIAGTTELAVSTPDDPIDAPVQSSTGAEIIRKNTNPLTRDSLRGL